MLEKKTKKKNQNNLNYIEEKITAIDTEVYQFNKENNEKINFKGDKIGSGNFGQVYLCDLEINNHTIGSSKNL